MENKKDQRNEEDQQNEKHTHKSNNAANIDSIISSPTENVRSRMASHDAIGNTGTSISYEGPTAPGGSAGTGFTSGQDGTGAAITSDSDSAYVHGGSSNEPETEKTSDDRNDRAEDTGKDEAGENDTMGNP